LNRPLINKAVDEAALVSKLQAGDRFAFDSLLELYQDRIFNFVRRMVNDPLDAEDIAQEVFIRAYTNIHRFDNRAGFSTWLYKIASNLCIDHVRRRSRRPDVFSLTRDQFEEESQQHDVADERFDPEQALLENEMASVISHAVVCLSPKLKQVLLLHDTENMSYEEIAQVVQCPLGTIKSRLFLARTELQKAVRAYLSGGEK